MHMHADIVWLTLIYTLHIWYFLSTFKIDSHHVDKSWHMTNKIPGHVWLVSTINEETSIFQRFQIGVLGSPSRVLEAGSGCGRHGRA